MKYTVAVNGDITVITISTSDYLEFAGILSGNATVSTPTKEVDKKILIQKVLLKLGFLASQSGYKYLTEAILYVVNQPALSKIKASVIYRNISNMYSITDSKVEKAIRHSCYTLRVNANKEYIKEIFGYIYNDKIVNSEIIMRIADYIRNVSLN